jgi:hypothetical protein
MISSMISARLKETTNVHVFGWPGWWTLPHLRVYGRIFRGPDATSAVGSAMLAALKQITHSRGVTRRRSARVATG